MQEENAEDQVRVHLKILGHVQGVFFRNSTQEKAIRLGLRGWVRNCSDGSVETVAEGKRWDVGEWIRWCSNGPPRARVQKVDIRWNLCGGKLDDFQIRR